MQTQRNKASLEEAVTGDTRTQLFVCLSCWYLTLYKCVFYLVTKEVGTILSVVPLFYFKGLVLRFLSSTVFVLNLYFYLSLSTETKIPVAMR